MKYSALNIQGRGELANEYVAFTSQTAHSLSFSVLPRSYYVAENAISPGAVDAFWFPNQLVKPGDSIILFTKAGLNTNRTDASGVTSYFFYWGRPDSVWKNRESCAVLVDAATWVTTQREATPLQGIASLFRPDPNRSP